MEHPTTPTVADTILAMPVLPVALYFVGGYDELLLEILRRIRSNTPVRERSRELLALGQVNRRLYNFVLPLATAEIILQHARSLALVMRFVHTAYPALSAEVK